MFRKTLKCAAGGCRKRAIFNLGYCKKHLALPGVRYEPPRETR